MTKKQKVKDNSKRKKWRLKGTTTHKETARIHNGSKKTGKKLNKQIRKYFNRERKEQIRIQYLNQGGEYCNYCREPHSTRNCPRIAKKLSKASTKRAAKIRRKQRKLDKRQSQGQFQHCHFCKGAHTSSDCPTLDDDSISQSEMAAKLKSDDSDNNITAATKIVVGAVPVFDFAAISQKDY